MKRLQLRPSAAWLVGVIASLAICYLPGSFAMLVVAMWGGFSDVSVLSKWLTAGTTLAAIAFVVYLLARLIAQGLMAK
ncbi:hypothetical protein ACWGM0_04100 [Sphingomonas bisphenolicum]